MAIILKHPFCGDCNKYPCSKFSKGAEMKKTDRGQLCNGLEFEHKGCFDKKGDKVRELQFYPKLIADDIMVDYTFCTVGDKMYYYKNGVYLPDAEALIMQEAQERLRDDKEENGKGEGAIVRDSAICSTHRKLEVVSFIRDHTHMTLRGYPKEQPPNYINVKNGFFDLEHWQIIPHTPDIFSVSQIPINYIEPMGELVEAPECPNIIKFLGQVLSPEDISKVLEFFGYCLYPAYPIRRAFMLHGGGHNGKTVLLNILRRFLGDKNFCSVSLQQLSENNRFAKANLFGKLANIYGDLPDKSLADTGVFKVLTGEEKLYAEWKGQDGFEFRNYAKLIFSCNRIPKTPDDTDAFFERWEIIDFPNTFEDNGDILPPLVEDGELEGLLYISLKYLDDLLIRNKFSGSLSTEEKRKKYIRLSDSIGAFVQDEMEAQYDGEIRKTDLYDSYAAYCRKNHYRAVAENYFFRDLRKVADIKEGRKKEENGQVRYIFGLIYKSVNNNNLPQKSDFNPTILTLEGFRSQDSQDSGVFPYHIIARERTGAGACAQGVEKCLTIPAILTISKNEEKETSAKKEAP